MQDLENKRGVRRQKTHNAIEKQKRIAKQSHWVGRHPDQPHRYAKHHVMDCGQPDCVACGNPRRIWKQKTIQEKKFIQNERDYDE